MVGVRHAVQRQGLHRLDDGTKRVDPAVAIVEIVPRLVVRDAADLVRSVAHDLTDVASGEIGVDAEHKRADAGRQRSGEAGSGGGPRATARSRAHHADAGRKEVELLAAGSVVLGVVATRSADRDHVGVRDDLVLRDVDVVPVTAGPEDGRASAFAAPAGCEDDGVLQDCRQRPVRAVRPETRRNDVCARCRIRAGDLHAWIGRIGNGPRERRLSGHLVVAGGHQHQLGLRCRPASVNAVVVTRGRHPRAERSVVVVRVVRHGLLEVPAAVEEAGFADDSHRQVAVRDVEAVVDDREADSGS